MTRPRAYQVNDPQTNYVKYSLGLTPGSSVVTLTGGSLTSFLAATVTGILGGAEEDCPAVLTGTPGPFASISPSDRFAVRMRGANGGNPMVVTFVSGDFVTVGGVSVLTAAKVAAAINRDLGSYFGGTASVASDSLGAVRITSHEYSGSDAVDTGDAAWVTVTDVGYTAGTVAKLNLGTTTATENGVTGPRRGIITKSANNRGGYFPLRYENGEAVLSIPSQGYYYTNGIYVDVVGGQAIYGRLDSVAPSSCRLSFFTLAMAPPSVVGTGGDFSQLGALDTLGVSLSVGGTAISFSVTFGTVNSVADAVSAINTAYQATGLGQARVTSAFPEPYQLDSTDSITLIIDGSYNSVAFSSVANQMTAQSAADRINTVFGTAVAFVVSSGGKNYLQVKSPTSGGLTSYVTVNSGSNRATLAKLGLVPGKVSGSDLCSVYGTTEIKFAVPFCESSSQIMTSFSMALSNSSGTPCQKMGFSPGTSYTSFVEVPVVPPAWAVAGLCPSMLMLIPETLEAGDVPNSESTALQQFMNQDPTSQLDLKYKGLENANKPVTLDKSGLVPSSVLNSSMPTLSLDTLTLGAAKDRAVPRLNVPWSTTVGDLTLVSESLPVPTSNPMTVPSLRTYVGSISSILYGHEIKTWNAKWTGTEWAKDILGMPASMMSWRKHLHDFACKIRFATNDSNWSASNWDRTIFDFSGSDTSSTLTFGTSTHVIDEAGTMKLADSNIGSAQGNINVFDNTAGSFVRLAEMDSLEGSPAVDTSLCRAVNARAYITVGDGVATFGDFNGTTGLEDAVAFLQGNGITTAMIQMKSGSYKAALTITLNACNYSIIGRPGDTVIILNPHDVAGDTLVLNRTSDNGRLWLKNVYFNFDGFATTTYHSLVLNGGAEVFAEDCYIKQIKISNPNGLNNADNCQANFKRCRLRNSGYNNMPVLAITDVAGGNMPMVFEDCNLYSNGINNRMVLIQASDSLTYQAVFDGLKFVRCRFQLSTGSVSGGYMTANTGLLDLHPGTGTGSQNDARAGMGMVIKRVVYEDCDVVVNNPTTGNNVLLHLLPTANGTDATSSPSPFAYVDELRFVRTKLDAFVYSAGTNPFTVAYGARLFSMAGCHVEFSSNTTSVYGTPTNDTHYAFTSYTTHPAAFKVSTDDVEVSDCDFVGFVHAAGGADTWWCYSHSLSVKNVNMREYSSLIGASGGTSFPDRNRFRHMQGAASMADPLVVYEPVGKIDGLHLQGKQAATVAADWGTLSYIRLDAENIHLTDSSVSGFLINTAVPGNTSGVSVFSDSSSWKASRFKITNCVVSNTYDGLSLTCSDTANGSGPFWVSGNTITNCAWYGIELSVDNLAGGGTVSDNQVSGCTRTGLKYNYPCTPDNAVRRLIVTGNRLLNNFSADPGAAPSYPCRQVIVYPRTLSGTHRPYMVFTGNILGDGTYGGGFGMAYYTGGSPYTAITSPEIGNPMIMGAQNDTDYNVGIPKVYYDDTYSMMNNMGVIINPNYSEV